jgi:putative transcriptional regulator
MKYKSDAFEAIHEDAVASFEVGAISEERMKEYNEMCLVKESDPDYEAEKAREPQVIEHSAVQI